jgi:hypothetical protein
MNLQGRGKFTALDKERTRYSMREEENNSVREKKDW